MTGLVYIVVSVCLGVVYGRKFCCFPDKWHGTEELMIGNSGPTYHFLYGSANITSDATLKAIYIEEQFDFKGKGVDIRIWQMYGQNVQFSVDNNDCTRLPLPDWSDVNHCIPDSAREMRKYSLGGSGIPVTEYAMNIEIVNTTLASLITVSEDCIPVTAQIYGSVEDDDDVMMFVTYGDIKPGIPDPSVFKVPDICKGAPEIDTKITSHRRRRAFIHV